MKIIETNLYKLNQKLKNSRFEAVDIGGINSRIYIVERGWLFKTLILRYDRKTEVSRDLKNVYIVESLVKDSSCAKTDLSSYEELEKLLGIEITLYV